MSPRFLALLGLYGLLVAALAFGGVGVRLLSGPFAGVTPFEVLLTSWVLLVVLRHPLPGERFLARTSHASSIRQIVGSVTILWTALLASTGVTLWFDGVIQVAAVAAILGLMLVVATSRVVTSRITLDLLVRELIAAAVLTALVLMVLGEDLVAGAGWYAPLVTGLGLILLFSPELSRRVSWFPKLGGFRAAAAPFIGMAFLPVTAFEPRQTAMFVALVLLPPVFALPELHATGLRVRASRRVGTFFAEPDDPVERALERIKGTQRRSAARAAWAVGEEIPDEWLLEDIGESNKFALGAQDPRMRGGEDLPDLLPGEVELARITLTGTVHGEVTSLRAVRTGDDEMELRLVDEYETEFDLPVTRVSGRLRTAEIVDVFARAEPALLSNGPFAVESARLPGIEQAFHDRFPDEMRPPGMPVTVAVRLRLWGRMLLIGSRWAVRGTFDLRGSATTFEIRTYVGFALVVRSLVLNLVPLAAPALYLLFVPTPALIVRRLRAIGSATFRDDLPKLLFGIGIIGVLGATLLDLPLILGPLLAAYMATILYVMLRKGPEEDAIVRRRIGLSD